MDGMILAALGGLVAIGLVIRIALLNARLDGIRETQQRMNDSNYNEGTADGLVRFLALVGFLAVCGLCFYLGVSASAWAR